MTSHGRSHGGQVIVRNLDDEVVARLKTKPDSAAVPSSRSCATLHQGDGPLYDCFYPALAEDEASLLVAADQRVVRRLSGTAWQPAASGPRA